MVGLLLCATSRLLPVDMHDHQKCDGSRPACSQCEKAGRGSECRYHDKKQVSRTEMLRAKQAKLEARLLELESGLSESSSGGTPVALSPESSSSGSQSEMNAFYPSNGE